MRKVLVETGFERSVSIAYQGWRYPVNYSEWVEVETDEELSKVRSRLRLRAMGSVYLAILDDFDRLTHLCEDSTMHQDIPRVRAQLMSLKSEAEQAIADVQTRLAAL